MRNVGAEFDATPVAPDESWSLRTHSGIGALVAHVAPRRRRSRHIADLRGWVAANPTALVVGLAVVLLPAVAHAPAIVTPSLSATIQTATTVAALAAVWLMRARFADSRRLRDLLTLSAVAALALTNFADHVLPTAIHLAPTGAFDAAALWGGLFVAGLFTAAAFVPAGRLVSRRRPALAIAIGLPVTAAALAILAGFFTRGVAIGVDTFTTVPDPSSKPLALALVVIATGLLGAAALALTYGRRQAEADPTAPTLVGGLLMMAVAGLYEVVLGVGSARGVSLSELPRAIGFSFILLAAVGYEPQARARLAKAAALTERRRIARDLHDGLAQDLAFIAAHASSLVEDIGEDHPVVIAARRALTISRVTINDLSDPAGASARESLEAVAQELRERFDIAIAVDVQLAADLDPQAREHVTRISREAIANAARHGGARNVSVSLRRLELAVVLRVVDDGCGLTDADGDTAHEGFGLGSMRDRAAALGGYLSLHRPQRGGTELEVVFR